MDAGNFPSPHTVRTQQSQLSTLDNPSCYTNESCLWNYHGFYPGLHSASCKELGTCKLCQPLPSAYPTSLPAMYVAAEHSPKSKSFYESDEPAYHRPTTTSGSSLPARLTVASEELGSSNPRCHVISTVKPSRDMLPQLRGLKSSTNHECCVPGCGKTYQRLSHLKAHMRWHGNPAPFKCRSATCGKRFSSEEKLDLHMRCHK